MLNSCSSANFSAADYLRRLQQRFSISAKDQMTYDKAATIVPFPSSTALSPAAPQAARRGD
ncbi:hypothetical protein KSP40_PGU008051 [Platanthera guangdongensis]|uniref:Uncharacterized protein n=1 Tax=Platanthera guangdongensis TaxID=2320717 RepID=A0ABR2MS55_9ASPA